MSSPISPRQLDADALAAFSAAAAQVAEDSLFAFAEPCDANAFAEAIAGRDDDEVWLTAAVRFHGPFDGQANIALPHGAAAELCAAFSGGAPDGIDAAQVADLTGEFANMACGLWLTRTHSHARFDLDPPRVSISARPPAPGACLLVNDAPMALVLHGCAGGR